MWTGGALESFDGWRDSVGGGRDGVNGVKGVAGGEGCGEVPDGCCAVAGDSGAVDVVGENGTGVAKGEPMLDIEGEEGSTYECLSSGLFCSSLLNSSWCTATLKRRQNCGSRTIAIFYYHPCVQSQPVVFVSSLENGMFPVELLVEGLGREQTEKIICRSRSVVVKVKVV
jgi:hypothetical protein